ncbi:hypothetical protein VSDG_03622 [Cytospora chrysosperma]|uniref:Uncharacterized protein n=1 Tax=Cytospora chrysosperma TaxID=252740 RepID=A0A423WA32_CYTCH|nr:hypothetical protein VSDG_03622 [Valsa sordida]
MPKLPPLIQTFDGFFVTGKQLAPATPASLVANARFGAASPAHQGGARRAALHAQGEGRGQREPLSLRSPSADIRPTPRADDGAQSTVASPSTNASASTHTSPPGISLIGGSSLVAIAREHSPQPYDDDASRRDVLENAVIPLLGMAGVDEAGMEHRHHQTSQNDDPYADLPGDQELLNLFSVYRLRVHPFQLIIDDLDAVESELCEIINQRAESSLAQKSQYQGDDILASKSASGGIFEKSLKALKLLRKITEEERLRKNQSDTIDRDTMAFSNPTFSDEAMNAVQDPGSAEFDELLRSFDFSSALPMEAFDYYTSDLTAPGANFEAFNPI